MTPKDIERITKICNEVIPVIRKKSREYNYSNDMSGMCAFASGLLLPKLKRHYSSTTAIVVNETFESHVYIEIRNHYIIDITARQFNPKHPKIVILDRTKLKQEFWFWKKSRTKFKSVKRFITYLQRTEWDNEQIPKI